MFNEFIYHHRILHSFTRGRIARALSNVYAHKVAVMKARISLKKKKRFNALFHLII